MNSPFIKTRNGSSFLWQYPFFWKSAALTGYFCICLSRILKENTLAITTSLNRKYFTRRFFFFFFSKTWNKPWLWGWNVCPKRSNIARRFRLWVRSKVGEKKVNDADMHCTRNCKNSKYHLYQNMLSYCKVCPSHVAENPFQHAC